MLFTYEHIHVMVNHVPLVGALAAAVVLLYALIGNDKHTLRAGALLLVLVGIAASVAMWSGEEAEHRIESTSLGGMIDAEGRAALDEHKQRAEIAAIGAYVSGGLALMLAVAAWWRPRITRIAAAILIASCLAAIALSAWTAEAGGRIRHPEFREPPTENVSPG